MVGNTISVLGLSVPLIDAVLEYHFPLLPWDGIGAGVVDLAGIAVGVAGLVLAVLSWPRLPRRRRGLRVGAAVTVNAVMAVLAVGGYGSAPDDVVDGQLAVAAGASGSLQLVLGVCHGNGVDEVAIDRAATDTNDTLADLNHRGRLTTFTTVDTATPGPGWQGKHLPARLGTSTRLTAYAVGPRDVLETVTFSVAQVRALHPGQVLWEDDRAPQHRRPTRATTLDTFRASICASDHDA